MNIPRQVRTSRSYDSSSRQQAAEEKRLRILDVSRKLFSRSGIDGVTITEIAGESGVATSTIYALFGSKTGILRALMLRAIFNTDYEATARKLNEASDPIEQLRLTAGVARSIYEGESKEVGLLRGASAFSSELKKLELEFEEKRYKQQHKRLTALFSRKQNLPGISLQQARDVMWTLTSRDVYRMLVTERHWSADQYEAWLGHTLVTSLARHGP